MNPLAALLPVALVAASLPAFAQGSQGQPVLLPQAPQGWRFERLELPLGFAPDLPLEGFEELRFAPGMFEPDSATYFTYVLALRLEQPGLIDAAFLEDFLVRYYRGLCAAVAGGNDLQLDLDAIAARVAPGAHGFVAEVDLFDAFTGGAPLHLTLELSLHPGPEHTDLFGLASPMPPGGEAWRALRAFGREWRATRPDSALLNHVFMVLSDVDYDALRGDAWWTRELGVFEERTTQQGERSYTGLYLYGRHTYVEFVRADPEQGLLVGDSGLALGLELPGATTRLAERLTQLELRSFAGRRTRNLDGREVPWFEILGIEQASTSSRFNLFTLEYLPEFLSGWHAQLAPSDAATTRHDVLARCAASLDAEDRRARSLLGDLVGVHLGLDAAEQARVLASAPALGLQVQDGQDGSTRLLGPGQEHTLRVQEGPGGIRGFDLTLTRDVPPRRFELGPFEASITGRTLRLRSKGD